MAKTTRESYDSEVTTPLGVVALSFQNDSMLRVKISRPEPFFREVEQRWNACHAEERDPHEPLLETVQVPGFDSMSEEARKEFVREFLYLAAEATQELQAGQETACASLEHHAEQIT